MPVTFEQTKQKYRGKKAATYETVRRKQERWDLENRAVEHYLEGARGPLLDVPVGTGRFLNLYDNLGFHSHGVDASKEMLALARKKRGAEMCVLREGDASDLEFEDGAFGTAVCVRFLDLIPEDSMRKVMAELCRVTRHRVVLTIRLGEKYVHKSNTCTHDRLKFYRAVKRLGWHVYHATPIFKQGWEVIRLDRT